MIPNGTARPHNPDLITIVELEHDYSAGQRWQVVTLYEDDHDAKNRLAWVSGTKPNGYILRVVIIDRTSEFHALDTMSFTKYRAAQDIANAINAYLEAHQ